MPVKKELKNDINSEKNNNDMPVKKRGRPKGSGKGKSRFDKLPTTEQGENTKFIEHDMKIYNLPDIDMNDNTQVKTRINEYFNICAVDDVKPSVASFALAFKVSRFTLFDILNGRNKARIKNYDCIHTIKTAYDIINSYYEHLMNNNKINPVAGIFLLKNNMGYKDVSEYAITNNAEYTPSLPDIIERANLLNE